jgi:hypothetical protein
MTGIGVERHIGDDAQLRKPGLDRLYRARHQAVRVPRFCRVVGLQAAIDDRKQRHRRHAQCDRLFRDAQQQVNADAADSGHGRHRFAARRSIQHEHRVDQVIRGQTMLAHQAARKIVPAHATHAGGRKVAGRRKGHHERPENKAQMILRCVSPASPPATGIDGTRSETCVSEHATVRAVTRFTSLSGCFFTRRFRPTALIPFSRGLFLFDADASYVECRVESQIGSAPDGGSSGVKPGRATTASTSSTPVFFRLENSSTFT